MNNENQMVPQETRKKNKPWLMLCILAVIGIALMMVGFISGAKMSMFVDRNGLHVGSAERSRQSQMDIDTFNDIEIDIASADIEIVPSDTYGLEIESSDSEPITYTLNRGILKIDQNYRKNWKIFDMDMDSDGQSIIIYVPSGKRLDNVSIKTLSGEINIIELVCERLNLKLASGNTDIESIEAKDITINSASGYVTINQGKADQFDFVLASGTLEAENMQSNGLSAQLISGNAKLEGQFKGKNTINVTSGDVEMYIDGDESDYNRNVSVVSGRVSVNGEENTTHIRSNNAKNDLDIKLVSGDVEVDFSR